VVLDRKAGDRPAGGIARDGTRLSPPRLVPGTGRGWPCYTRSAMKNPGDIPVGLFDIRSPDARGSNPLTRNLLILQSVPWDKQFPPSRQARGQECFMGEGN
jgi:hypothetical protein